MVRICRGAFEEKSLGKRNLGRIRALPPERRIYAAGVTFHERLPHECGDPAHDSSEFGGSARTRQYPWCQIEPPEATPQKYPKNTRFPPVARALG
jgi:hypothetical protein